MATIGNLIVNIGANIKGLQEGLNKSQTMVKLYTIPASEDPAKLLKELFFTVEVTPVDFTDPDTSNNAKIDEQIAP